MMLRSWNLSVQNHAAYNIDIDRHLISSFSSELLADNLAAFTRKLRVYVSYLN